MRSIEQELEELDGRKIQEWRRQFPPVESETPAVDSITEPDSRPELPQDGAIKVEAPATADAPVAPDVSDALGVEPASVPLPVDEDQETHSETASVGSPDASSEPAAVPLPLSSPETPPSDSAGQLNSNTTPASAELEPVSSSVDPAQESSRPELSVTEDGSVDAGSTAKHVDANDEPTKITSDGSPKIKDDRNLLH